jgi:glycosyltransferase involved in cell wall biosynthesis
MINDVAKIPLSVVVIAKNEEKRIAECLRSVCGWVDEIIVVDDESRDGTVRIAQQYTNKIFSRKMELEGRQRNFGVAQARNEWVMMLDCDERVTPELKEEIIETVKKNDPEMCAYWIKQICYLGNVQLRYGGWGNEHGRIYHKQRATWREDPYDLVHPGLVRTDSKYKVLVLKNALIHYNFKNLEDFVAKTNRYTTLEAIKWHLGGKGAKMPLGRALWRTVDRFFRRYIGRKGYKDGFWGFIAAILSSFYEILAYAKLREVRDFGFYLKDHGFDGKENSVKPIGDRSGGPLCGDKNPPAG